MEWRQLIINGTAGSVSLAVLVGCVPSYVGAVAVVLNVLGIVLSVRGERQ